MKLSDFDYSLPRELIAQFPADKRDNSRLLLLHRGSPQCGHYKFRQLPMFLNKGDLLVLNDTRVMNARLTGKRLGFKGKIEVLLIDKLGDNTYACLSKPSRRFKAGTRLVFDNGAIEAEVIDSRSNFKRIRFRADGDVSAMLEEAGQVPLPPYIKRKPSAQDRHRYQTVYAANKGAVAAPTAGLHFTKSLLSKIKDKGVETANITLHVSYATFKPVTESGISGHKMHKEYFEISEESADKISNAKKQNRRVVAVGTTSCRALESAAVVGTGGGVTVQARKAWTGLFIYPGYKFKVIDGLLTNFHFPRTTLLMLAAAFCGKDDIIKAYQEAVSKRYRFYSYGDAMLII